MSASLQMAGRGEGVPGDVEPAVAGEELVGMKDTESSLFLMRRIASTDVEVLQYTTEITVVRNGTYYSTERPY